MRFILHPSSFILSLLPVAAAAADAPAAAPAGSATQMLLGLLLVLGAIVATGWLARRFMPRHPAAGSALRVIAGAAVGQRERVVVVEVGSTWLVVGVAPGSVRALHTLPRIDTAVKAQAPVAAQPGFADRLRQFTETRGGR